IDINRCDQIISVFVSGLKFDTKGSVVESYIHENCVGKKYVKRKEVQGCMKNSKQVNGDKIFPIANDRIKSRTSNKEKPSTAMNQRPSYIHNCKRVAMLPQKFMTPFAPYNVTLNDD
ncbi:hypothetical protein Bhyg_15232, partial [Pseudolycoriella hygida]